MISSFITYTTNVITVANVVLITVAKIRLVGPSAQVLGCI